MGNEPNIPRIRAVTLSFSGEELSHEVAFCTSKYLDKNRLPTETEANYLLYTRWLPDREPISTSVRLLDEPYCLYLGLFCGWVVSAKSVAYSSLIGASDGERKLI
jgi:hypothetical protein